MLDYALVGLAFCATVLGACGATRATVAGKTRINALGIATILVAVAIATTSAFRVHARGERERELQESLRSTERVVFAQTVRFGGGNALDWEGPARIPGGSTIELTGFDVELYVMIDGMEGFHVPVSKRRPQVVRVPGTPGEVAYEWRVGVLNEADRVGRSNFQMGTVQVRSTYKLGEWAHTRK